MLVRFYENYNLLKVIVDYKENIWRYTVFDRYGDELDDGWTTVVNLELHYPMNEVDYILQFCEPDGVSGEYEILPYAEVENYFSPTETPDGEWLLERKGLENDIRTYARLDEAQRVMEQEYLSEETVDERCCFSDNALVAADGFYQHWQIDQKVTHSNPVDEKIALLQKELDRAQLGVSQYTYELGSTDVIRDHLDKMEVMLEELKELISRKDS